MTKNFILSLFIAFGNAVFGHGVTVSNVALNGQDITLDFTLVNFDITWNNSWRTSSGPSNWDAAWVFVKYRLKTQTTWNHATLNWVDGTGSGDGHTEPANSNIASSNDNGAGGAYGVFIHRNANMAQGTVNYPGAKLRWNYGIDGLADNDSVEICVFAIEMVYVPQGSFYAGDGTSSTIHGQFESGISGAPFQITSEGALTLGGGGAGSMGNRNAFAMVTADDFNDGTSQTLPAAFPKGYNAFYCMKYEVTQEQYVAFLNKLDNQAQATARHYIGGTFRNTIAGTLGSYTTTNPYVACNWLSWADLAAYLDWAALRPMTELEFEKACRGTLTAVANECAWGSASFTGATGISNAGLTNETASNAGANCTIDNVAGVQGPMRAGNFGQGVNTRVGTGASYYGIMELSGNLLERPVTVGNATGRAFTGIHGNGVLTGGNADVGNWPGNNAIGAGFRAGAWWEAVIYLRVSGRRYAAHIVSVKANYYGGRGVRLVP